MSEKNFDNLFVQSIDIILHAGKCSHALLQRRLMIDYEVAHRIYRKLEEKGYIERTSEARPADVFIEINNQLKYLNASPLLQRNQKGFKWAIIAIVSLGLIVAWWYWFQWRPSLAIKYCSSKYSDRTYQGVNDYKDCLHEKGL